jgi:hypothetical protein
MADIILVAVTFAFIAICLGYVSWCDRIIGPDDFGVDPESDPDTMSSVDPAASAAPVEVPTEVTV